MARSPVFPAATYSPPEESSFHQDVISTVENTMKKYTDNLMRFLEGISSRLSQLELYCYNLDKSIGEMRSDLVRDHGESESKLKTLEKHIQEVHRSVQILRDKQELADTQKELAKLQLAQESSSSGNTPKKEERASQTALEVKRSDNSSDGHDQQLALALTHQVAPQPSLPARPVEHQQQPPPPSSMPPQSMAQVQAYYLPPQQMTNIPAPSQPPQTQYQMQDHSRMPPQPSQSQVNQTPQLQSLPPYQQQQWAPQSVQPPQQPLMQPQIRTSSQMVYSSYMPTQSNQTPAEVAPNSIPMQVSYVGAPQPGSEAIPYGYGATGRPIQPQPPTQHLKSGYGPQSGESYVSSGPRPALPPGNAYMMFDGEGGGRTHFQQSGYPPNNIPPQNQQRMPTNASMVGGGPQSMRSHPYNELIEKLVSMGYRGDHVVGIIQRLEESGQPIDFNSVLDRLNGHNSSGGSQRGWSG
ncbi:hypothetical protein BUALT_Bualt18G0028400 [Buddleja alternifolia]|uniref:DUF1421 domain-containing protein n=1 Tax=Buddleja alternifolia TaxID=168488 RepID=A0AAV6W2Z2_9LAMI|nr:hypothetical protein BUALT_Bualt18G0028400 [Buddleja alternifolia]